VLYQCKSNSTLCFRSFFPLLNMICSCHNNPNSFCYICVEVVLKSHGKPLPKLVGNAYELHCGSKIGGEENLWGPRICCSSCSRTLAGEGKRKRRVCPFKANISQNKRGQGKRRDFSWSTTLVIQNSMQQKEKPGSKLERQKKLSRR